MTDVYISSPTGGHPISVRGNNRGRHELNDTQQRKTGNSMKTPGLMVFGVVWYNVGWG